MNKIFTIVILFLSQFINAEWITSFDDAQKIALATNKFMIVDFWATWCRPCKQMDMESWNDEQVKVILQDFVQAKINITNNSELAKRYDISGIPYMLIMDGNGNVVYSFLGYRTAVELRKEIEKFALSTEYLSLDLINYYKVKNYNTALQVSLKYFDYSLLLDKEIKSNILKISSDYLYIARKELKKKDEDYKEKIQKLDLVELYYYAFNSNFEKLNKKLEGFKELEIKENNINQYYFLKYLTSKALKKDNLPSLEQKVKAIDGFDYFIKKADLILALKD